MMKIMKRNYFFAALTLCCVLMVPALGAQTLDQTTLGQADTSAGAAPTVAPALPAVGALSSPQAAAGAAPAEQAAAQPSAIETMFAGQMAALGVKGPALTQFGYSLFDNPVVPSLSSIGDDYVLGPGDGLVLYLWGDPVDIKELSSAYNLTVDRNGNLFLPPAGQISVLGQNLGSVRSVIKGMLDRRYKKLELSLTLSALRQFPVNVSGYVEKPGTVLATGADTVFSVLSRAGGIAKTGSLRSVRFVRGTATKTIDFYDMLISGSSIDLRVREGDSVYVPAVGPVAAFAGELRRPGIYELPGTTSVTSALGLAGGLLPSARSSGVTRLSFSESGRSLANGSLSDAGFAGSAVSDGDFFYVGAASDLLIGQVQVSGPVKYAGKYQTTSVSTLSALLARAQLLPETNLYYGRVYRTDLSGRDKSFAFSPEDVLVGADIGLTDFDRVVLYRYDDTSADPEFDRFSNTLMLSGPVKYPGFYLYKSGMKLSEVVTKEQVLLDTNLNYGELTRLKGDGKNEYVTFRPGEVLGGSWDMALGPRDVIKLVKVGYGPEEPDFDRYGDVVQVSGPVEFGGLYAWRAGMKLSGLLGLAKPKLDTNQVYAEVVRSLGGGKSEYLTFAPREVLSGAFDMELSARDSVKLYYKTASAGVTKQGAEAATQSAVLQPTVAQSVPAAAQGMQGAPVLPAAQGAGSLSPATTQTQAQVTTQAPTQAAAPQMLATTQAGVQQAGVAAVAPTAESADISHYLEVVTVSGAVRYAGPYARTPTLKLSDVISADQILETTNLEYAELTRVKVDGSYEYKTFAPREVLEGKYDLTLRARDMIRLISKTVFGGTSAGSNVEKFADVVQLTGQVARPEVYALRTGMKLSEVVTKEQVLLDTNLNYGELTRLKGDGKNEYVTFRPGEVLGGSWDMALGPRDVIKLVKVGYGPEEPDFDRYGDVVQVSGPVEFGGLYAWRAGMKLSGLLGLAKPKLDTNQVYAEVTRLGAGGVTQTLTFALREVNAGTFDMDLSARDTVRLFSNQPVKVPDAQSVPVAQPDAAGNDQRTDQPVAAPVTAVQAIANGQAGAAGQPAAAGNQTGTGGQPGASASLGFYLDVVSVRGQVRYEGPYARTPTLKLSSVVTPDQILETTDLEYAELTRRNADGSWSYKTFSPREVLAGTWDLPLQAQDSIQFFQAGYLPDKPDYDRFGDVYAITGAAKFAGLYAMHGTKLLSDILTDDQLLGATDIHYAEIDRWVAGGRTEYLTFSPSAVLKGEMDMNIFPRDVIRLVTAGQNGDNHDFTRYTNTVVVKGIVRHPGRFAWYKGLSLSSILTEDELLIDTDVSYAEIRRRNADRETILSFSPASIAAGGSDVALEARDVIILYPKYYNKPVSVSGEVVEPKVIPYYEGIELAAVLRSVTLKAGINSLKAVVTKAAGGSQDVYLEDYLHRQAAQKVILAPGDAVSIKMLLPDENLPIVTVRGAVGKPQSLDFKEGMRLSDALAGVGGYGERAYPKGLVLIRKTAAEAQQKQVERLMAQLEAVSSAGAALPTSTDTSLSSTAATIANMQIDLVSQRSRLGMLKQLYKEGFGRISIDMPDTLQELAASPSNIVLERDDMIFVPTTPTYVLVSGDVADQAVVAYRDGIKVRDAIALSGWLNNSADMDKAYIIKASGRLVSTEGKSGLFSKPTILDYKLEPGDTVVVPSKTVKVSQTWSYIKDVVDIAYKIMTTALTTVSLLGLL